MVEFDEAISATGSAGKSGKASESATKILLLGVVVVELGNLSPLSMCSDIVIIRAETLTATSVEVWSVRQANAKQRCGASRRSDCHQIDEMSSVTKGVMSRMDEGWMAVRREVRSSVSRVMPTITCLRFLSLSRPVQSRT